MLSPEELRVVVQVDTLDLVSECACQPELFLEASEHAADAKAVMEKAKSELEQTESLVDFEIRSGRIDYTGLKLTDVSIAQLIKREIRVKEARKLYQEACTRARKLEALEKAFDQKRSMLSYITELTGRGYLHTADIKSSAESRIADVRRQQSASRGS